MANNLDPSIPEYWSRRMQRKHHKNDVYRAITNFEEQKTLKEGDTVHRPYRSDLKSRSYTRGTAFTVQDITTTDESLLVDKVEIVPFYVDDVDVLQHNYRIRNEFSDDSAVVLGNQIDGEILGEILNADSNNVLDDSTLGGTSGNGVEVTIANIVNIFGKANRLLDVAKVARSERYCIMSPHFHDLLWQRFEGKETMLGDKAGLNGKVGHYAGFDLFMSNSLPGTGVLALATTPTDGDTITVAGVVFTFKTSLGSTAGNVLIGADADAARANLGAAISGGSGAGTTYVALSTANQDTLHNYSTSNNDTNNILTVTGKGESYLTVSETLTDATDTWTAEKQLQHIMFGKKKAIDVVIQKRPNVQIKDVPDKLGVNVVPWTVFGKKTFSEGTVELVDCKVRSDNF